MKFRAWDRTNERMLLNEDQGYEGQVWQWKSEGQDLEITSMCGATQDGIPYYDGDILTVYGIGTVLVSFSQLHGLSFECTHMGDDVPLCDVLTNVEAVVGNIWQDA